jgi:hypothetical protein
MGWGIHGDILMEFRHKLCAPIANAARLCYLSRMATAVYAPGAIARPAQRQTQFVFALAVQRRSSAASPLLTRSLRQDHQFSFGRPVSANKCC